MGVEHPRCCPEDHAGAPPWECLADCSSDVATWGRSHPKWKARGDVGRASPKMAAARWLDATSLSHYGHMKEELGPSSSACAWLFCASPFSERSENAAPALLAEQGGLVF